MQVYKFVSPTIFLRQFHLESSNFWQWSLLQSSPSMYNYSNKTWVSPDPYDSITLDEIASKELDYVGTQINHFPARLITFRTDRDVFKRGKVKSVYVRSTFRGTTRLTAYEIVFNENNSVEVHVKEVRHENK